MSKKLRLKGLSSVLVLLSFLFVGFSANAADLTFDTGFTPVGKADYTFTTATGGTLTATVTDGDAVYYEWLQEPLLKVNGEGVDVSSANGNPATVMSWTLEGGKTYTFNYYVDKNPSEIGTWTFTYSGTLGDGTGGEGEGGDTPGTGGDETYTWETLQPGQTYYSNSVGAVMLKYTPTTAGTLSVRQAGSYESYLYAYEPSYSEEWEWSNNTPIGTGYQTLDGYYVLEYGLDAGTTYYVVAKPNSGDPITSLEYEWREADASGFQDLTLGETYSLNAQSPVYKWTADADGILTITTNYASGAVAFPGQGQYCLFTDPNLSNLAVPIDINRTASGEDENSGYEITVAVTAGSTYYLWCDYMAFDPPYQIDFTLTFEAGAKAAAKLVVIYPTPGTAYDVANYRSNMSITTSPSNTTVESVTYSYTGPDGLVSASTTGEMMGDSYYIWVLPITQALDKGEVLSDITINVKGLKANGQYVTENEINSNYVTLGDNGDLTITYTVGSPISFESLTMPDPFYQIWPDRPEGNSVATIKFNGPVDNTRLQKFSVVQGRVVAGDTGGESEKASVELPLGAVTASGNEIQVNFAGIDMSSLTPGTVTLMGSAWGENGLMADFGGQSIMTQYVTLVEGTAPGTDVKPEPAEPVVTDGSYEGVHVQEGVNYPYTLDYSFAYNENGTITATASYTWTEQTPVGATPDVTISYPENVNLPSGATTEKTYEEGETVSVVAWIAVMGGRLETTINYTVGKSATVDAPEQPEPADAYSATLNFSGDAEALAGMTITSAEGKTFTVTDNSAVVTYGDNADGVQFTIVVNKAIDWIDPPTATVESEPSNNVYNWEFFSMVSTETTTDLYLTLYPGANGATFDFTVGEGGSFGGDIPTWYNTFKVENVEGIASIINDRKDEIIDFSSGSFNTEYDLNEAPLVIVITPNEGYEVSVTCDQNSELYTIETTDNVVTVTLKANEDPLAGVDGATFTVTATETTPAPTGTYYTVVGKIFADGSESKIMTQDGEDWTLKASLLPNVSFYIQKYEDGVAGEIITGYSIGTGSTIEKLGEGYWAEPKDDMFSWDWVIAESVASADGTELTMVFKPYGDQWTLTVLGEETTGPEIGDVTYSLMVENEPLSDGEDDYYTYVVPGFQYITVYAGEETVTLAPNDADGNSPVAFIKIVNANDPETSVGGVESFENGQLKLWDPFEATGKFIIEVPDAVFAVNGVYAPAAKFYFTTGEGVENVAVGLSVNGTVLNPMDPETVTGVVTEINIISEEGTPELAGDVNDIELTLIGAAGEGDDDQEVAQDKVLENAFSGYENGVLSIAPGIIAQAGEYKVYVPEGTFTVDGKVSYDVTGLFIVETVETPAPEAVTVKEITPENNSNINPGAGEDFSFEITFTGDVKINSAMAGPRGNIQMTYEPVPANNSEYASVWNFTFPTSYVQEVRDGAIDDPESEIVAQLVATITAEDEEGNEVLVDGSEYINVTYPVVIESYGVDFNVVTPTEVEGSFNSFNVTPLEGYSTIVGYDNQANYPNCLQGIQILNSNGEVVANGVSAAVESDGSAEEGETPDYEAGETGVIYFAPAITESGTYTIKFPYHALEITKAGDMTDSNFNSAEKEVTFTVTVTGGTTPSQNELVLDDEEFQPEAGEKYYYTPSEDGYLTWTLESTELMMKPFGLYTADGVEVEPVETNIEDGAMGMSGFYEGTYAIYPVVADNQYYFTWNKDQVNSLFTFSTELEGGGDEPGPEPGEAPVVYLAQGTVNGGSSSCRPADNDLMLDYDESTGVYSISFDITSNNIAYTFYSKNDDGTWVNYGPAGSASATWGDEPSYEYNTYGVTLTQFVKAFDINSSYDWGATAGFFSLRGGITSGNMVLTLDIAGNQMTLTVNDNGGSTPEPETGAFIETIVPQAGDAYAISLDQPQITLTEEATEKGVESMKAVLYNLGQEVASFDLVYNPRMGVWMPMNSEEDVLLYEGKEYELKVTITYEDGTVDNETIFYNGLEPSDTPEPALPEAWLVMPYFPNQEHVPGIQVAWGDYCPLAFVTPAGWDPNNDPDPKVYGTVLIPGEQTPRSYQLVIVDNVPGEEGGGTGSGSAYPNTVNFNKFFDGDALEGTAHDFSIPGDYVITIPANLFLVTVDGVQIPNKEVQLVYHCGGEGSDLGNATATPENGTYVPALDVVFLNWGEPVSLVEEPTTVEVRINGEIAGEAPVTIYEGLLDGGIFSTYAAGDDINYAMVDLSEIVDYNTTGVVTFVVPAGMVQNEEGATNSVQSFEYTILALSYADQWTPDFTEVDKVANTEKVTISWSDAVIEFNPFASTTAITATNQATNGVVYFSDGDGLSLENNVLVLDLSRIEEEGVYNFSVPQGLVLVGDDMMNAETDATYTVTVGSEEVKYWTAPYTMVTPESDIQPSLGPVTIMWDMYYDLELVDGAVAKLYHSDAALELGDLIDDAVEVNVMNATPAPETGEEGFDYPSDVYNKINGLVFSPDFFAVWGMTGTFTFVLPAGSVMNQYGEVNPEAMAIIHVVPAWTGAMEVTPECPNYESVTVNQLPYITISFPGAEAVSVNEGVEIRLDSQYGQNNINVSDRITNIVTDENGNEIGIEFYVADLAEEIGTYTLVVPEGAFTIMANGEIYVNGVEGYYEFTTTEVTVGVNSIVGAQEGRYVVYNMNGVLLLNTENEADLQLLQPGLYIINGKKVLIRK